MERFIRNIERFASCDESNPIAARATKDVVSIQFDLVSQRFT
jgi:hypothetical protein